MRLYDCVQSYQINILMFCNVFLLLIESEGHFKSFCSHVSRTDNEEGKWKITKMAHNSSVKLKQEKRNKWQKWYIKNLNITDNYYIKQRTGRKVTEPFLHFTTLCCEPATATPATVHLSHKLRRKLGLRAFVIKNVFSCKDNRRKLLL